MKSKYHMGWLFVCFDLPVVEKEDLRKATKFRQKLLHLGYFMLQNSVYVRSCVTYEKTAKYTKYIEEIAPSTGSVYVFYITDSQWSNSKCIENVDYHQSKFKKKMGDDDEMEQMSFW